MTCTGMTCMHKDMQPCPAGLEPESRSDKCRSKPHPLPPREQSRDVKQLVA